MAVLSWWSDLSGERNLPEIGAPRARGAVRASSPDS
jgi:hypothetical protein